MATQSPHVLVVDHSRVDCLVASIVLNSFNIRGIMIIMSFYNNYRVVFTNVLILSFSYIFIKIENVGTILSEI
jgi:hypothetical protein